MNGKICFISLANLYLTPYLNKYITIINTPFDIIYWNRHAIKEESSANNLFSFNYPMNESSTKIDKLLGYVKFRRYAKRILEKNGYSGVIVLTTSAGILLNRELNKSYSKKYIVDIRDYSFEDNSVYYAIEKKMIKNSSLSVISSRGYESFLPKHNYILTHNDVSISSLIIEEFRKKNTKTIRDKISISYIGLIRFHEQNKKVIKKFANDERFNLNFIGTDSHALQPFCEELNIKNVRFVDRFPPETTLNYYKETDIINNLYGNNSNLLDYALSNKLYYAALLGIPILVSPNTYMEEVACQYGFGFSVDLNSSNVCDEIYDYYHSINWDEFYSSCDKFLESVKFDNDRFQVSIEKFIFNITNGG
ncbi:capsular biosynthesis protein [Paenibacillus sp. FSL E2-0190]|uniref:capsular biosynthesis protein n=1 Tax=Paenibacillus sp. FSL E2-0190 TaxID=2954504 RepID=UPI0030EE2A57